MPDANIEEKYSKTDLVCRSLRIKIKKGGFANGSRLPGIRELARIFGVSNGTVDRALGSLEKEGIVERRVGSGVFITIGPDAPVMEGLKEVAPRKARAEQIVGQICEKISSGIYKAGQPLPLNKALRFQFHTSSESLGSALETLLQKGLIHRKGGGFIVGPPDATRNPVKNCAYLVPVKSTSGGLVWGRSPRANFHIAFAKELSNYGVSFLGQHNVSADSKNPNQLISRDNALGFVCSARNQRWVEMVAGGNIELLTKEIRRLNNLGLPVVLYSSAPILRCFPEFRFKGLRNVYPFGVDNLAAGQATARYLGTMGHKRIAFFSVSTDHWNNSRYEGAKKGIRDVCGGQGEIIGFHAGIEKFSYRRKRENHKKRRNKLLTKLISETLPDLPFSWDLPLNRIWTSIRRMAVVDHHQFVLKPLLEKALGDSTITAWIGADQTVAIIANRFLDEAGLTAPRQVSVISVDDDTDLSDQGITACNLCLDQMGYLAAHCLLGDIPIKKDKRGVVECPPKIIERGTVGRV